MIKATCPCGGTFETATGYRDDDRKNVFEWLSLHHACVNERVLEQAIANKKSLLIKNEDYKDMEALLRDAVDEYAVKNDLNKESDMHWANIAISHFLKEKII